MDSELRAPQGTPLPPCIFCSEAQARGPSAQAFVPGLPTAPHLPAGQCFTRTRARYWGCAWGVLTARGQPEVPLPLPPPTASHWPCPLCQPAEPSMDR